MSLTCQESLVNKLKETFILQILLQHTFPCTILKELLLFSTKKKKKGQFVK